MIAKLGAAFLVGFLSGILVCWMRLQCLGTRVKLLEYYFGERIQEQWNERAKPLGESRTDSPAEKSESCSAIAKKRS